MKLYDYSGAPNPRRVRVFLAEKGVDVETVQVNIFEKENLSPEFEAVNPRRIVPSLVLDDGTLIDESLAICRYFEATHPEPALFGTTAKEQGVIESWARRIEQDGFSQAAYVIRNENPRFVDRAVAGLTDCPQIPELTERGRKGLSAFYVTLNDQLAKSQYVAGDNYSVADITAMCAVDFGEFVGVAVPSHLTALASWRERMAARESSKA